jgi:hydrogenase-4 membrane subunit HyfE
MILAFVSYFQEGLEKLNSSDYSFMVGIQIFLLVVYFLLVNYFCKTLKRQEPQKSTKKTCMLIWFFSAIAWFIIAQIVWVITSIQFSGG